jgi:hypothetical protein
MSHHRVAGGVRSAAGVALAVALAAGSAIAVPAGVARAQDGGKGFLFREPIVQFTVRGGYAVAAAGSDVFSFTTEQLTVNRRDFSSGTITAGMSFRVSPRLDLALEGAYMGKGTASEFRDWEDNDDRPIEQTTDFRRIPFTASAKLYLASRGRSLGEFAWVPARFAPYVGAGGGAMWYRFRQVGDFVDFKTLDVYGDRLESSGWSPTVHAMAGADLTLSPHVGLTGEVRYGYGKGKMSRDFEGFDRIDLSGATVNAGLFFRF